MHVAPWSLGVSKAGIPKILLIVMYQHICYIKLILTLTPVPLICGGLFQRFGGIYMLRDLYFDFDLLISTILNFCCNCTFDFFYYMSVLSVVLKTSFADGAFQLKIKFIYLYYLIFTQISPTRPTCLVVHIHLLLEYFHRCFDSYVIMYTYIQLYT